MASEKKADVFGTYLKTIRELETPQRRRKTDVGTVLSAKGDKTRVVAIERLVPHPKYGKFLRKRTICYAHDEANETRVGDMVEIMETRPLSKLKRWRIVRIVRKGTLWSLAEERADSLDPGSREPS